MKQIWLNGDIAREIEKIAGLKVTRPENLSRKHAYVANNGRKEKLFS